MGVKWLKAVMMVAFVLVFAAATNHCRLEIIEGLEFLVCCTHDGAEAPDHAAPHQDDDCETDGCASLEEGLYKSEDSRIPQIVPLIVVAEVLPADGERLMHHLPDAPFSTFAIPELPASWQFLLRVASAPRAPSIAS